MSPSDILQGIDDLKSVLDLIGTYSNVLDGVVKAAEDLARLHPIAQVAIRALSIPYKFLKNEQEFNQDLTVLGDVIRKLLLCLTDVQYAAKIKPVKKVFVNILKTILEAASFIDGHLKRNRLARITSAQFRTELDNFTSQFGRLREDYRDAILTQIAKVTASVEEEAKNDKLLRVLDPCEHEGLGLRCMDGTRKDVLGMIDKWLKDGDGPNIM